MKHDKQLKHEKTEISDRHSASGRKTVRVVCDSNDEYAYYFDQTWPKALEKLKEISE